MRLLFAVSAVALGLFGVSAQGAESSPVPVSSPGTWIDTEDYPAVAKGYEMSGITGFRLSVDPAGKPNDCQITQSSGFDILDRATCQQLMARAEFTPALDARGKAVAGAYSNRVRWELPPSPPISLVEGSVRNLLRIDQAGTIISCSLIAGIGGDIPFAQLSQCPSNMPTELALAFRGQNSEPVARVELEWSFALTPEARDKFLTVRDGYETRGASVFWFQIDALGIKKNCVIEQQRGDEKVIFNFCYLPAWSKFAPSLDDSGKPVVASGWFISRILHKSPD